MAQVAARINAERIELAEEPVHADVTWVSAYDVDPFAVADRRQGGAARRLEPRGSSPAPASTTSTRPLRQVAGEQVLRRQRTARSPPSSGSGSARSRGHGADPDDRLRLDAHARAAGRPRLGIPHRRRWDWDAELAELPELLRREAQGALGRGRRTTW